MSDDRSKRAKRLQRTANVIKKQLRIAKNSWNSGHLMKQPHRFAKSHALDCGNPKCIVCHSEKIFGNPTLQERKFVEGNKTDNLDS